jgi:hypothetical protein
MSHLSGRRPSAAMLVAIVAVALALSGTAVAATKLVSGDSLIKRGSLSGNRLRAHSVGAKQIRLSSLGTVPNAAHAARADTASTAVTADSATRAATAGSAPVAKLTYVTTTFSVPTDGTATTGTANCPSGTNVTGGGANIDDPVDGTFVASYPAGKTGWNAVYDDINGGPSVTATVYAICAPAAATG